MLTYFHFIMNMLPFLHEIYAKFYINNNTYIINMVKVIKYDMMHVEKINLQNTSWLFVDLKNLDA